MENWTLLLLFIAVNFAAAMTGGIFKPGAWYRNLAKPSWTPPDWLFPPAWTVLYATVAYSGYLFTHTSEPDERLIPLIIYGVQLVFNAAWSALFFGAKRMDLALIDSVLMFVAIAATIAAFAPVSPLAAGLLVPYLCWVGFATALNYSMLRHNTATRSTIS